jgi:hypothetical protein
MDYSPTKEEDRSEFPYAREATHSGRAVEVMSPQERPHPYARRPSLPMLDGGPRIHLPNPGHEGSSRSDAPRIMSGPQSQPVNIPGISSLDRDGPWHRSADRERYWEDRSKQSENDKRVPMSRTASTGHPQQVRLPSLFHSLSSSEPHHGDPLGFGSTPSVMPPPPRPRTNPPSPRFAYTRPRSPPHLSVSHSLRPSYSSHSGPIDRREMQDYPSVKREGSPPLRSIHMYESPGHYPHPSANHYPHADGRAPPYHGHHQRHPAQFADPRPHHPGYAEPHRRQEEERPTGPGQSRRLAHLMSEQKRRESVDLIKY